MLKNTCINKKYTQSPPTANKTNNISKLYKNCGKTDSISSYLKHYHLRTEFTNALGFFSFKKIYVDSP